MNLQQFEIKRLFEEEGLSVYKICKLLGLAQSRVKKTLRESGVEYEKIFNDTEEIKEFILLFQEGKTFREIESITGKTYTYIRCSLIERGYTETKTPDASPEVIEEIIRLYGEGNSSSKVAKLLGISATTVKKFVPKEIKKKKAFYNTYSCNYQFFDSIDNEINAYFLGLFYADGYNNQKTKTIRLGFAEGDKELLSKFLMAIESNHPIKVRERNIGKAQTFYYSDLCSAILSDDLAKHGCVVAKTHVLDKMPEMSEELYRHFIRGYFDGDGSVYYTQSGNVDKITLSWTGNKPFLEDVQAYLIKELEVSKTAIYISHPDRNNLIGDLRYSNGTATKIHNWMYSDCQYYSERKKMIPVLRPQVIGEKGREYARSVMDEFYNKINKSIKDV